MSNKHKTVDDSRPVECYAFTGPFGNYYYTDYVEAVTLGGTTYEPLAVSRGAIDINTIIDSPITNDILIPSETELAKLYAFVTSPEFLKVEVFQAHHGDDWSTDYKRVWYGEALEYRTGRDGMTVIKTGSLLQAAMTGNLLHVNYQRVCNHELFDSRCKVDRDLFTVEATVTLVRGRYITVDDDGYNNGELERGTFTILRTGEKRGIVGNTDNELLLGETPINIKVGDTVELVRGCDHIRLSDCKNVFNNVANYGGFDFIPGENPFERLNLDNSSTITTDVRRGKIAYRAPLIATS